MLKTVADGPLNDAEWQEFLRTNDFGQIVALGVNRELPVITPTHIIYDAINGVEFHVHRANPLLDALRER
jgi:transcriptional regulator